MKKIVICFLALMCFCFVFCSCTSVTILNSSEAKLRMEEKGYAVDVSLRNGENAASFQVQQVTILNAQKGDEFLQVYYFTNEEDTETFFNMRANSIMDGVDIAKKNKYSIYRGTEQAVEDFLVK